MNANINKIDRLIPAGLAIVLVTLLMAQPALGVPIQGQFTNDPANCDNVLDTTLTHELGDSTVFPINEQLFITVTPINTTVCVSDDGIANDWDIRIINIGSVYWEDVFFVADEAIDFSLGNWDGYMSDLASPGDTHAFRIDAIGTNNNLISESITSDGILEPGEIWAFHVSNFGTSAPPLFDSVGQFAFSSSSGPPSTASILANPVPEPVTMSLLAIGGLALIRRRRHNK